MSITIRENEIDVEQIMELVSPQDLQDALEHVEAAQEALKPLRDLYDCNTPEVIRALVVVDNALQDALNQMLDGEDEVSPEATTIAKALRNGEVVILDELDCREQEDEE